MFSLHTVTPHDSNGMHSCACAYIHAHTHSPGMDRAFHRHRAPSCLAHTDSLPLHSSWPACSSKSHSRVHSPDYRRPSARLDRGPPDADRPTPPLVRVRTGVNRDRTGARKASLPRAGVRCPRSGVGSPPDSPRSAFASRPAHSRAAGPICSPRQGVENEERMTRRREQGQGVENEERMTRRRERGEDDKASRMRSGYISARPHQARLRPTHLFGEARTTMPRRRSASAGLIRPWAARSGRVPEAEQVRASREPDPNERATLPIPLAPGKDRPR